MFLRIALALTFALTVVGAQATVMLRRGNVAEPNTLDTQKYSLTIEAEIIRDLHVGLLTVNARAEPVPGAAESWTISPDGLVYTFKLRKGIQWSDGTPLTAQDAVMGLRRAFDPATESWFANQVYKIKNAQAVNKGKAKPEALGVRSLDPSTVEITLEHPSPVLLMQLAQMPMLYPVPFHLIEKHGDNWARAGTMVSSGPYVLAAWRKDDHIRLVKNPRFYDASNVAIDEVFFYPTVDDLAALNRFRAGELDLNLRFPPNQIGFLRKNLPDQIRITPSLGIYYIAPNVTKKPFDDPRVRRALSLAIDRPAITANILKNGERPFWGMVPDTIPGYTTGAPADPRPLEERQAEAVKLLATAGFGPQNPLRFTLNHRAGLGNKLTAVAIANMWSRIGVEVKLLQLEVAAHYNALREGDFTIADAGWTGQADPEYFVYLVLTGSTEINWGRYSNPQVDRLNDQAIRIMDLKERYRVFAEAEAKAMAETAIIPVYIYVERALVKPWVKGFEDNPVGFHPTRFMRIEGRP